MLASPVSQPSASAIAILPANIIMIGVSEYSTASLTQDGKKLIENAILMQLGINIPMATEQIVNRQSSNCKFIQNGQLFIEASGALYDAMGHRINR